MSIWDEKVIKLLMFEKCPTHTITVPCACDTINCGVEFVVTHKPCDPCHRYDCYDSKFEFVKQYTQNPPEDTPQQNPPDELWGVLEGDEEDEEDEEDSVDLSAMD